jgi:hypothetical protein
MKIILFITFKYKESYIFNSILNLRYKSNLFKYLKITK